MSTSKWLGLLLVAACIIVLQVLAVLDIRNVFEPGLLLPILNTLFAGIMPIFVAYVAGKTYLKTGSTTVLFMGCGMLSFGLCAVVAGWMIRASDGPNLNVTVYNTGALIGSLFHSIGVVLSLAGKTSLRSPGKEKLTFASAYLGVAAFVACFSLASLRGLIPPFFVQGVGPTGLRQLILGNAVFLYAFSSMFLMGHYFQWKSDFFYWYSLSLSLLAIGLFAFFLQKSVGCPIGWFGRSANYASGLLALVAIFSALKDAKTKRVSLESAIAGLLADTEAGYRSLVETATDAIATLDNEGEIIDWNSSAEKMFGYTKEEIIGFPFFERIIPEEFVGALKKEIRSSIRSGKEPFPGNRIEIEAKRRDGTLLPVELSLSVRKVSFGWASTWILRDVTQRKHAEAKLERAKTELELRVKERTTELESANEKLITEIENRKRAEKSVTAERRRLYDILETMPVMVCLLTADYHVAFANRSFRDRFGEDNGRHCYDYCFGREAPCEFCESYNVLKTGQPHHWEVTGPDGSIIDTYDFPFTDTDGSPLILEMDIDITERRRAEEGLQAASAYNRSLIEASLDPLVTISAGGKITDVNTATEKVTGFSRENLVGTDFSDYFTDPQKARAGYQQVFRDGSVTDYELAIRHKDGRVTPVMYSASVYRDGSGTIAGVFAAARDITESKRAENIVRARLRLVQYADSHTLDELLQATLDEAEALTDSSIGFFHFVEADQKALSLQAWSTRTLREMCTAEGKGRHYDLDKAGVWVDSIKERKPVIHNDYSALPHRRGMPPGHANVIRELVAPIFRGDKLVAIVGVGNKPADYDTDDIETVSLLADFAWDIAERKRAEIEREKLITELEAKNAELERFTYSISHDLRSPLITIRTFLGFVAEEAAKGNTQNIKPDLERIDKAAEKMGQLLGEILELSRVGRMFNPPSEASVGDLVNEALELLSGRIARHGLEVQIAPDLPLLYVDRPRVLEVFQNLIENSVKFMGDQPHPRIEIGARQDGEETVLFVRDNGIGIKPAYHDKVFGLFNKLDPETEGTGIGLALVKRIVEVHGGRMWVESEGAARGSTFCFTLPGPVPPADL